MNKPDRIPLNIPSADEAFARRIHRYSIPPPSLPPWPWRATMICALNCYLLWSLTWVLYLINISVFTFSGQHLWFYTTIEFFGLTVPELFLSLSILLSLFTLSAVIGLTRHTPRLWKRLLAVTIFAAIAIWTSCLSLHLRHYSYECALFSRELAFQEYEEVLTTDPLDESEHNDYRLRWRKEKFEEYDALIKRYEQKFHLAPSNVIIDD